jgi:acetylornithine deacetylase
LEENGIKPAGCVVGEPTSMQPIIAHKGMNRFRCTVRGREAHSSYVTHGVNAIEYAARLIVYIRQIADRLAQFEQRDCGFTVPYTTLSTGLIRGGIAANVMPKECEFQFDMRTLPHASADALYQEIRAMRKQLAREMRAIEPQAGIDLEWASQTRRASQRPRAMPSCNGRCSSRGNQLDRQGVLRHGGGPVQADGRADRDPAVRATSPRHIGPNEFVALEQLAQCEAFMDRILETGMPRGRS